MSFYVRHIFYKNIFFLLFHIIYNNEQEEKRNNSSFKFIRTLQYREFIDENLWWHICECIE